MDGTILVDAVVSLVPPKVSAMQLPANGSPAQVAQPVPGPGVSVTAAFHHVGAKKHRGKKADCDVLVFADDVSALERVIGRPCLRSIADGISTRIAATDGA